MPFDYNENYSDFVLISDCKVKLFCFPNKTYIKLARLSIALVLFERSPKNKTLEASKG